MSPLPLALPQPERNSSHPGRCLLPVLPVIPQQVTCQFAGRTGAALALILHGSPRGSRADLNDVNVVPGLSEPHGPDGAMADGGRIRAALSQHGAAGHL